jgi:SAM-dependent methyltransferase
MHEPPADTSDGTPPGGGDAAGASHAPSGSYDPAGYGETHAGVYDRIYPAFATDAAVARIVAMAAATPGPVLDLGVGTGRLAIPLRAAGVDAHGIDASPAMLAELRARPGGAAVPVREADIADFDLPDRFAVVVCAVSTLFMLPDRGRQAACLRAARRHLRPGGLVVVEAFVPDPGRFDDDGRRVELRRFDDDGFHLVVSHHRPDRQTITVVHVVADGPGVLRRQVVLHYATVAELDAMAGEAGLVLVGRHGGWDGRPPGPDTTDLVSTYQARQH